MAIDVPIFRGGQRFRALTVTMATESFPRLLNSREIPANWLAGIIDEQGRYIARVPDHERVVGELASEGWRLTAGRSGLFEFQFREGDLIDIAVEHKIIEKSGAWFAYGGERLGQGRENVKSYLKENLDLRTAIEERVRKALGMTKETPEPVGV